MFIYGTDFILNLGLTVAAYLCQRNDAIKLVGWQNCYWVFTYHDYKYLSKFFLFLSGCDNTSQLLGGRGQSSKISRWFSGATEQVWGQPQLYMAPSQTKKKTKNLSKS